jgi:cytochrome c
MTFAGLGDPQERADVIAFLNSHSDSPLPLPKAPAAAAPAAAGTAPGTGPNNGPAKASEKEPVLKTGPAEANPKNSGGPAAPTTGPAPPAAKSH